MNVLFICSANMCRSPMAEGYLRKLAEERDMTDVQVRSAAMFFFGGFPATKGARWTAEANGFELNGHRSVTLDNELYAWADVILVMTHDHKQDIVTRFGQNAEIKTFLLGEFDPDLARGEEVSPEIDDPYGGANVTYENVFNRIRRSIDAWFEQARI